MAIEGFPSPENNEEEEKEAESVDDSDVNSAESTEIGVGKNAEKYIDGDDAISHKFSGPVREHLDDETIEKLEKMKKRQENQDDENDQNQKKKAA